MQVDTDVFIDNKELDEVRFEVRSYSSFIVFGLKKDYRGLVDFHLDTHFFHEPAHRTAQVVQ